MNFRKLTGLDALYNVQHVTSFSTTTEVDELLMISESNSFPNRPPSFIHSDEELPPQSKGLLEAAHWPVDPNYVIRLPKGVVYRGTTAVNRSDVLYYDLAIQAGRHLRPNYLKTSDDGSMYFDAPWQEPEYRKGSAAILFFSDACGLHHSHWLIHALPKILLFEKAQVVPDYYVVTETIQPYQRETLHALGIRPEQLIVCNPNVPTVFDSLYVSYTNNPMQSDLTVYDRISSLCSVDTHAPQRVYVHRLHNRNVRRFLNEIEVIETARQLGFTIIDTSVLSFEEEMNVFYNARIVAGPVGAGLCNALFMKPHGTMIAISDPGYVVDWYMQIAALKQHSMTHLFGNGFLSMERIHRGTQNNWCLDPTIFKNVVERYI